VTGVEDPDVVDENVMVTVASNGLASQTVTVSTSDNDALKINAAQSTLIVPEGGPGTIDVTLGFQPTGNVVVAVSNSNPMAGTISPTSLTFTPSNWNVTQVVTVTGAQDNTEYDHDITTVSFTATGLTGDSTSVTVEDNDLLWVTPDEGQTCQFGSVGFYTGLHGPPLSTLTVTITTADPDLSASGSHTFTPQNWQTAIFFFAISTNENTTYDNMATIQAPGQVSKKVYVDVIYNPNCEFGAQAPTPEQ